MSRSRIRKAISPESWKGNRIPKKIKPGYDIIIPRDPVIIDLTLFLKYL